MYKSTAVNVLTAVLAVFLSVLLALSGVATACVYVVSSSFSSDTVVTVLRDADFAEILSEEVILDGLDPDCEIDDDLYEDLIDSEMFEQIIEEMTSGIVGAITGEYEDEIIDARDIRSIIKDNIDEIVEIIDDNVESDYSRRELEDMILDEADSIADEIANNAPMADDIAGGMDRATQDILAFVFSGKLLLVIIAVTVILAVCVYLLRYKYLGGLIWVGFSGFVVSVIALTLGAATELMVSAMAEDAMHQSDTVIVNSLADVISGKFVSVGLIVGAASIVMILVGFLVGKLLKKRNKAKAA